MANGQYGVHGHIVTSRVITVRVLERARAQILHLLPVDPIVQEVQQSVRYAR